MYGNWHLFGDIMHVSDCSYNLWGLHKVMQLKARVLKVMLAKQILTNPPKTFERRFPDPDHPQVPTFYCNLRIPKCSDAWPIMTAPQGKRPLEMEGKDMHSQDLVPSTVVEQWRVNYVNWDDTFDISIEGSWVCSNWDPFRGWVVCPSSSSLIQFHYFFWE